MGRGPELTKRQREIIYRNAIAAHSKAVCDAELESQGYPPVHASSYAQNLSREGALFRARPELMAKFVISPVKYGDWPDEWRNLVATKRRAKAR